MTETEVKILEINTAEIEQNILAAGGEKIFEGKLLSKSFDSEDGIIENNNRTLRLRQTPEKVYITYKEGKKTVNGIRSAEEYEITVSDAETAEVIIKKLGYTDVTKVREKIRTSYKLGSVQIEIDGEESAIHEALKILDYTMNDTTDLTASQVLKKYGADPTKQLFTQ